MKALTVIERESEIMKYLRQAIDERKPGATIKEIYDAVSEKLEDTVTIQAYYKLLNRMETAEKIERVPASNEDAAALYRPTQRLTVDNAMTLDDFYDLLPIAESTTELLAALERAQLYYDQKRKTTLRVAALALLREDASWVFFGMLKYWIEVFERDLESYRYEDTRDDGSKWTPFADAQMLKRLKVLYKLLERIAYRALSIPRSALNLPSPLRDFRHKGKLTYDYNELREVLRRRVFGDTFLHVEDVSATRGTPDRVRLTVSGSDGSMHAGSLALRTASAFFEGEGHIITFNNSIACLVRKSPSSRSGETQLTHSVPFTRQALDDPKNKGMVLAHSLFRDLTESEYEHMTRCATDVVQFRVDADVMTGRARDVNTHADWPTPRVHIRDGTIAPQEREFGHYNRLDAYGSMVREGIKLERIILDRLIASPSPPIFAGAVKSTQMRIFGYALDWYIAHGSKNRPGSEGVAIDPDWDAALAEQASDNTVMTYLFTSLDSPREAGRYYVSCALLREFPSLTEYHNRDMRGQTWAEFFENERRFDLERHEQRNETLHYHASPDAPADLRDDDFVFMCEHADYVSFYVGHTGGEPPPSVPRYEFLTSLRHWGQRASKDEIAAAERVRKTITDLVTALDEVQFTYDSDHNFLSSKLLVKVVPSIVYRAHELCKQLGKKLEAELKSTVIRLLAQNRQVNNPDAEVTVRPVPIRRYLEQYLSATRDQSADEDRR